MGKMNKYIAATGKYLCGVKYWAQWKTIGTIPQYEVYVYIGLQKNNQGNDVYFFRSTLQADRYIAKTREDIRHHGFKPFCIDTEEAKKFINGGGTPPPETPSLPFKPFIPPEFA